MHIPSGSLRTTQTLPEQLPAETQAYALLKAGIAAARRFESDYGEYPLDLLRLQQHHAQYQDARSALVRLRERDILGLDDPLLQIRHALRHCSEEEAELHGAGAEMMFEVAAARDALAAWCALRGAGEA